MCLLPLVSALPAIAQTPAKEDIVAKDTFNIPNVVCPVQTKKPTAVKVGDVVAPHVSYFCEITGYYWYGWLITKIDSTGIEGYSAFFSPNWVNRPEHIDRIKYGEKRTFSDGSGKGRTITIKAEKGKTLGTAIVTTVSSTASLQDTIFGK